MRGKKEENMARKFRILTLLILPLHFLLSSIVHEVPVEHVKYTIDTIDGFDRIVVSGSFSSGMPGHPELPG